MRKSIFILFIIITSLCAKAEEKPKTKSHFNIESRFHYGFIWPHHKSIRYLQRGHVPAFDFRLSKTMYKQNWAKLYRQPELGIGYYHNNLQWKEVLGNIDALYSFIKIPIIKNPKFKINYSFSLGSAHISKYFNIENNYYNIAIGSRINVYVNFALEAEIQLRKNLKLLLGADLSHVSNGAVRKPNLGFNLPAINCGFKYTVNPKTFEDYSTKLQNYNKNIFNVFVIGSLGWKEINPPGGNQYLTSTTWIDAGYMFTKKKRIGIGLDIFYDGSIAKRIEKGNTDEKINQNNLRQGAHISYDLIFGKVFFTVQAGYYFLVDWNDDPNLYNRLGLRYQHNNFIYNVSLKTHLGRADYIEWGIGYVLFQKQY